MSNKPTIAEILHITADKYLNEDGSYDVFKNLFSCCAISDAIYADNRDNMYNDISNRIADGLEELGLDTLSLEQFDEFPPGPIRQGARYNWLKFVALLAEEQGV